MCNTFQVLIESQDNEYNFIKYTISTENYNEIKEMLAKFDQG